MHRAKHTSGKWVYGELFHLNQRPYISTGNLFAQVIPGTEGRETGMKDLQGERIFEGDIYEVNGRMVVVAYDPESASFVGKWDGDQDFLSDLPLIKKLGNIVDNPELIEWEVDDWMRAYNAVMQSGVKVEKKVVSRIG